MSTSNIYSLRGSTSQRSIAFMVLAALMLVAMLAPTIAFAQDMGALPTLSDIQASAGSPESDTSRMILKRLFGKFGEEPFVSVGAADTLLGILFFTFNAVIFVVGTSYVIYQIIMAVAASAHEGEVLGKRMNALWAPIRLGVGTFGMVPVFKGFSLAQSLILSTALLGIGMANMMVDKTVEAAQQFKALIPPPGMVSIVNANGSVTDEIANNLFMMNVCVAASEDYLAWYDHIPIVNNFTGPKITSNEKGVITQSSMTKCGDILINDQSDKMRTDDGWMRKLGLGGFRNPAVNYEAINAMAKTSVAERLNTLHNVQADVQPLARQWYQQAKTGNIQPYPIDQIRLAVDSRLSAEQLALEAAARGSQDRSAFADGIAKKMKEGGWLSIGSWYSAFAEQDAAIQSAFVSNYMEIKQPDFSDTPLPSAIQDPLLKAMYVREIALAEQQDDCSIMGLPMPGRNRNIVGECNWGQGAAMALLGSLNDGGEGMVNPILTAKNIGDYMLSFVGGAFTLASIDKLSSIMSSDEKGRAVEKKQAKDNNKLTEAVMSFGGKIMSALLMACLILGLVFAVYIPLIPFITWYTATVSYFASVIEGLVGAQIWAFSHLSTDGEGMGQRTEKGYVYLLNMLLRPALMVLGFFFASALMTIMATFLYQQLGTALANMQGDTNTGPLIVVGLMFCYMILLIVMIQTLCNLIYEIPDRVIAWFGHSMEAKLAKQMDSATEGKMDQSARWAGQTAAIYTGRV